jgi:hypothetical protein
MGDAFGEILIDMTQMSDDGLAHLNMLHLRKFENERGRDVRLLISSLAAIELPCLAVVVGKAFCADAAFVSRSFTSALRKPVVGLSRGES